MGFPSNPSDDLLHALEWGLLEACRARQTSNTPPGFKRSDYPEGNPAEWRKWITIKLDQGQVTAGSLALDFHGDIVKNYQSHLGT